MSSSIKGYQSKNNPRNFEYATVENLGGNQFGLTSSSTVFYENTVSDAAEANSTELQIVATAHTAREGDLIRVTSGANSGYMRRVYSVDANDINVLDAFPSVFGVGDTFDILRPSVPTVDQLGSSVIVGSFAEDSPAADGDSGLFILAVRNDSNAALTSNDGDYSAIAVDDAGRIKTIEGAVAADGSAGLPSEVKVIGGYDGTNVRVVHTDAAGDIQIDLASSIPAGTNNIGDVDVLTEPATSADASAGLPSVSKIIAGYDGANIRTVHTDASGDVQVDLASSIPAGTNNIGDVDVLTEPATVADGGALPAVVKVIGGYDGSVVQAISTDANGRLNMNVVDPLPAGTNNIGDVDVLSLPGGITGYAEDSAHSSGDIGVLPLAVRNDAGTALAGSSGDYIPLSTDGSGNLRTLANQGGAPWSQNITQVSGSSISLGQNTMANSLPVVLASDGSTLNVTQSGRSKVNLIRNDYSSTNVTTAAYVQLLASTSATINRLQVFDSSGQTLVFAVGAAASEVDQFYIFPGGNGDVELSIPSGSRLSVKAVSATASTGEIDINTFS